VLILAARRTWQEALVLILAAVVLTACFYHARIPTLPPQPRLLAWVAINFGLQFLIPVMVIKLVFKRRLSEFGLQWGRSWIWSRYLAVFLVALVPVILISAQWPSFQGYYSTHLWAMQSAGHFALFAAAWLVYFFGWEFFFRGFMLFALARNMGALAIFVQTIPFTMMHFNKPPTECYAAVIAGIALGLMAYRGRSFIGCWLLHWIIAMIMYTLVLTKNAALSSP
jgi:uncharacterized protein